MPEDAASRTRPLITRLVKTWFEINGLWLLAAIMAIINSCLLCCCGPSSPIVLKAEANMTVVCWAFVPAPPPIRATAARLCGPLEHVSGSVQTWPRWCSLATRWKLQSIATALCFFGQATSVGDCVECEGSSGPRWPTMQKICSNSLSLRVTLSGAAHVWVCSVCACGERRQPGHNSATPLARQSAQITPSLQKLNTAGG